jgi:transposase
MFVRLKRVRCYRYLQLVESVRTDNKPRQRVLATLGRVEQLQAEGSIDALVSSLSKFSPNALALIAGKSSPETQALTIGPVLIFERLWQRLKLESILKELLGERHFGFAVERAVFLSVLHRVCCGGSDRQAHQWKEDYEIAGVSKLSLHHSYRAMAWLGQAEPRTDLTAAGATRAPADVAGTKKSATATAPSKSCRGPTPIYRWRGLKDKIEKSLWVERQDLFSQLSMVFFDTTSLYFEGAGGQSLGQRGHSKDSRPDLPQLIVGVVLDGQGEPLCCEMWPGNATDVKGLIPVLQNVRERFGIGRVCVVADRGFISKKTLGQLEQKERGWDFILGVRMRASKEAREEVVGKLGSLADAEQRKGFTVVPGERKNAKDPSPLEVKEVLVGERRYVVCYNPEQARKDAADRSGIVAALRATLKQGDQALVGNQGFRKYLQVTDKHFEVDEAKLQEEARYDGLWVLRTNTALSVAQVALRYKELWMVEQLFRDTKTLLKTRPIFHQRDETTIRGHVFCTFLGLVLLKELDRCLRAAGLDLEHHEVMRDLKALQRMRIDDDGKVFWLRSQVQGCCAKVFSAVGVALPPLLTLEPEGKQVAKSAGGRRAARCSPSARSRHRW